MEAQGKRGGDEEESTRRVVRTRVVTETEAVVDRRRGVAALVPLGLPPETVVPPPPSRAARPSGGKDRHSKVNTAKGPRDRRVRLSVPTAVQFYDVQDRLGFDQPSKAVEWLIRKAKPAIDELAQIPPQGGGEASEDTQSAAAAATIAAIAT